jgi:serine/threonine protein phosphatase 1
MRSFAIGDIHGGLKALKQLIERLKLTNDDHLIFMGDYVDGWSESAQVIKYVI